MVTGWSRRPDDRTLLRKARVAAWEQYGRGLDFSKWQFPNVSFRGASLQRIRLAGARLSSASLIRANLTAAVLSGAELTGANLSEADLSAAELRGVRLVADPPGDRGGAQTSPSF